MNQFESENDRNEFDPEQVESADFERADPESIQFEAELTLAMNHVDPPVGFADGVLAKVTEPAPQKARILMMPRRVQAWVGGAIAAALLVGAFGIQQQHERKQREEAARQQHQLELALQITGETLANVRAQVELAGVRLGD